MASDGCIFDAFLLGQFTVSPGLWGWKEPQGALGALGGTRGK